MGNEDSEKTEGTKKRLTLTDSRAVRASLCKLARQYHNGQIPDVKIRNLTYILNSIVQADKFISVETELTNKFDQLERLVSGQGGTIVDPKSLDSPYAQNLKKQLENERKTNENLMADILELKRLQAGIMADSGQGIDG